MVLLTKLTVRNFKRFEFAEIELGGTVVFIGPNNSGKTTALQALALWSLGLRTWLDKRGNQTETPTQRPGVTINRRDLLALPVPDAKLLWRNLHVRDTQRVSGRQQTTNVRVDVVVEGVTGAESWACGLEFDLANEESFYCRPLRLTEAKSPARMPVPTVATSARVAFLPPMSGLAATETRLDPGAIEVALGEGRTADVLRNLCYLVWQAAARDRWEHLVARIKTLFGVSLDPPEYLAARSELTMTYRDALGVRLDISAAGRGLQQTLLLLAHLSWNPGAALLLDEPDAHLEILRQRQIYRVLTEAAREQESQIIAASHSEVVLNEAAERDVVVAFVGAPHRIDDRGSQVSKSLRAIGFEQYYEAELTGWVLYLEGSTDLAMLQAFAERLDHPARSVLSDAFVHYIANQPQKAREHFHGLLEAKSDLVGYALFDRLAQPCAGGGGLTMVMWRQREIENYLCQRVTLTAWAAAQGEARDGGPLFALRWRKAMDEAIAEVAGAMRTLGKGSPWSPETKVTDDFLDPLFVNFFARLELPNLMRKSNYHTLARYVPTEEMDAEIGLVLDGIVSVAHRARPFGGPRH